MICWVATNSEPYVAVSTLVSCFLVIYKTIRQGLNWPGGGDTGDCDLPVFKSCMMSERIDILLQYGCLNCTDPWQSWVTYGHMTTKYVYLLWLLCQTFPIRCMPVVGTADHRSSPITGGFLEVSTKSDQMFEVTKTFGAARNLPIDIVAQKISYWHREIAHWKAPIKLWYCLISSGLASSVMVRDDPQLPWVYTFGVRVRVL